MSKSLLKTLGVIALAALVAGGYVYSPALIALVRGVPAQVAAKNAPAAAPATAPVNVNFAPAMTLDLPAAIDQGLVQAEFLCNGREKMRISVTNKGTQAVRLHIPAGLIFQNETSSVALLRSGNIDLKAGELKEADLQTAATSSSNHVADAAYSLTLLNEPKLTALTAYLEKHPEVSQAAIQTAVLALKENLPVSAFAKFAQAGSDIPSKYDTTAFKVEVADIIGALTMLREMGVKDEQLALTFDPQLKIEAMIDPMAHAAAMHYYGITAATEWEYWKGHLLKGDESTRHYALYGIARFYPDIALQMLPAWIRENRTSIVYRVSAVQALAETQRPEAVSMLRQIEHEFGMLTEIGKAAHNAADVLDARLNKAGGSKAVAFRTTTDAAPPQVALQ